MTTLQSKRHPHGLKGRPGNNQTKKGRNLRYVIQAKKFRDRLVRGAHSGGADRTESKIVKDGSGNKHEWRAATFDW